ncbi:hypothetical protein Tco_0583259 [Tanacetum coccineum]
MVGSWFRMFKGDRIRIRETLLGELMQQEIGVHIIELGIANKGQGKTNQVLYTIMGMDICTYFPLLKSDHGMLHFFFKDKSSDAKLKRMDAYWMRKAALSGC